MKKARSDAQKATTARMRVKLEERRRDLVVIKQEAKETALLQQLELKAHIKDKLKAKQLKTKADEKIRQMKKANLRNASQLFVKNSRPILVQNLNQKR
jgi:hypothetical protein